MDAGREQRISGIDRISSAHKEPNNNQDNPVNPINQGSDAI
jgi:hypothetical protein